MLLCLLQISVMCMDVFVPWLMGIREVGGTGGTDKTFLDQPHSGSEGEI